MFRKYGLLGILMILFVEINFILKIQPFAGWYFPIVWFGYIFVVDALVYKIKGRSLMSNNMKEFLILLLISAVFWWIFEFVNFRLENWSYFSDGLPTTLSRNMWMATISFSTVVPAVVETMHLLESIRKLSHIHLHKHFKITRHFLYWMVFAGILAFTLVFVIPKLAFPLVWLAFFLILDPINYIHGVPSIVGHLKQGNWRFVILLGLAGLICGFFWEFWNYWAIIKWQYNIPYVGFLKIFEMPILGYLGYLPFGLELYAMYHFVRSLHIPHRLHELKIVEKIESYV
ncbi:MAG: hypothetical protein AABW87_04080 [Nanoarchaeota archaeon]